MTTIGITGGIGSGKSFVCKLLAKRYGIPVYDTDSQAKRLMLESTDIRQALINLLGKEAYLRDGQLNKALLASYLFQSEDNAQRINAIVHPVVANDFHKWVNTYRTTGDEREPAKLLVLESAILFESGFNRLVDKTICVTASIELCIERAMKRDGASREAILSRMERQMSDAERQSLADFIIVNDGAMHANAEQSEHNIEQEINKILKQLC